LSMYFIFLNYGYSCAPVTVVPRTGICSTPLFYYEFVISLFSFNSIFERGPCPDIRSGAPDNPFLQFTVFSCLVRESALSGRVLDNIWKVPV
jgi:hypothetical protein